MQRQNYKPSSNPPLSHGVRVGDLIYVSGQVAFDANGQVVPGGIEEQTRQTIENLRAVLEGMGSSLDKVFKTTCFILDKADFAAFNKVYAEYFGANPPARSTVAVKELMRADLVVEIEAIAHV